MKLKKTPVFAPDEDAGRTVEAPPSQTPAPTQAQPVPPERMTRARAVHKNYYRWLRLSRLALGAFVLLGGVILLWLIPWLPSGLDTSDYTPEMAFTVYLLGAAALLGVLALGLQERARRDRESLMIWAAVYDEATGLHNRTYLNDRLALECERAQRGGGVFSVIVLQLRVGTPDAARTPALSKTALQMVGELVDRLTQPGDAVALLSGSELAVLAMGVDKENRRALQERLRGGVAGGLPMFLDQPAIIDVKGGTATYGVDGTDPGTLVQAARTAAVLAVPHRAQAA